MLSRLMGHESVASITGFLQAFSDRCCEIAIALAILGTEPFGAERPATRKPQSVCAKPLAIYFALRE
jgi:hypothetical protein